MSTDAPAQPHSKAASPPRLSGLIGLPILRVVLVGLAAVSTWLVLVAAGDDASFPPMMLYAAISMFVVNLITLAVVRGALHAEGRRARDLIDFSWRRLGTDVLWGLLWLMVLWIPFALAVVGVGFAMYGPDVFTRFETLFYDPSYVPTFDRPILALLAIVAVVTFAPLNAPTEELLYRGYSQGGLLSRGWPAAWAILVPAVVFAAQHVFYAATPGAVPIYLVAFLVWGIGSGIIVRWQGRLMPIIVAHFLVNLMTSAPALLVLALP
ncbi:CPBP family intramembrane glutamic endopeptidase [Agromyces sp. Marseille-P2726]|uniref:CPBP family intramembrane glutamic endopeptidase n=1 Tax=Agromyces sp. Marseille-P2726 TaxID=2709132 RepID=UPI00156EB7F5|nr:CPBP family intramembrane glutamic endopeptidase [Agromyces sp. Marseille-P2726]